MSKAVAEYRNAEALLVLSASAADREGYAAEMSAHRDEVAQAGRRLAAQLATKDDAAAYRDFTAAWAAYQQTSGEVVAAGKRGDTEAALTLLGGTSQEQYDRISAVLGRIVDAAEDGAKRQVAYGAATYTFTSRSVFAALLACVLFGMLGAGAIGRLISHPVREIADKMRRLAAGESTRPASGAVTAR